MLNLPKRELPTVEFRRELPLYLAGDGAKECFIRIDARAAGSVNPKYVALREQLFNKTRVWDRQVDAFADANKDDHETVIAKDAENRRKAAIGRFSALYDACVIEWESNILDGDAPIAPTRDNFLALCEVKGVPELTQVLLAFEKECLEKGKVQAKADEDERGN